MIILLPKDVDGLARLEARLTAENLKKWLAELDKQPARRTELFLPRFKLENRYDVVDACRALGMTDAFDGLRADFRGMGLAKGSLWINQILHKAVVEVNEEGTEAAAATAVLLGRSAPHPFTFRADHPFLFIIRDEKTGSILFMGRMVKPQA